MKKFIITTAAFFILAFTSTKLNEKAIATVNQEHGLYVFVDSKPSKEYELVGTITSKRVNIDMKSLQGYELSYSQLKEEIFRQIDKKEKFSSGEALIIYPDLQKADVIKFK